MDERSKTGNPLVPVSSLERPDTRLPSGEGAGGSDETCTSLRYSLNASISARPPITTLSSREREVLALVAEGHSNKTIARELYISEFTARRHVQNVREEVNAGPPGALPFGSEQS